jgi:hypothetical protein
LTPKIDAKVDLKVRSATQVAQSKAYTSVQFEDENEVDKAHFELGSELVYINHGCEPNVAFELPGGWNGLEEGHWCLRSLSEIKEGDVSFLLLSGTPCLWSANEGYSWPGLLHSDISVVSDCCPITGLNICLF